MDFSFSNLFSGNRKKTSDKKEAGVSNVSVVGGYLISDERNTKLHDNYKQTTFDNMVRNHPIVAASMRVFLDFASKADWSSEPVDDTPEAQAAAEFADSLMENIDSSWSRMHKQAATYKFNGASILEWTAKIGDDGLWMFNSIEPRRMKTITRWDIDDDGQLLGVEQTAPVTSQKFYIPRSKMAMFVDDALTDQPDGVGLLRHAFRHVERLENLEELELQAFERDVRGLMVGRAPYADLQKALAAGDIDESEYRKAVQGLENIVRMQRKKPTTALTLDSKTYENQSDTGLANSNVKQWDIEILQGQQPGLNELNVAINRINTEISRIFGTEFLMLGADGAGSLALSNSKMSAFLESVNSANKDICDRANKDLLDVAWSKNGFDEALKPTWKVADLQERDLVDVAAVLRDLATAGIGSEDPANGEIRARMGLSPAPVLDIIDEGL